MQDEQDIEESWSFEAPLSDARKVLEGWDPVIQKILDKTPSPLIDWKLVYRDPLPTWISARRRIALIGDSAHPFLPTSIQLVFPSHLFPDLVKNCAPIYHMLMHAPKTPHVSMYIFPPINGSF